jgi:hypothetical protein
MEVYGILCNDEMERTATQGHGMKQEIDIFDNENKV